MLIQPKQALTILFICFCALFTFGQETAKYSFSFQGKTLEQSLIEIESTTEYRFYFIKNWLPEESINKTYSNATIDEILSDLLKDTVLNYFIYDGNQIMLSQNNAIYSKIPEGQLIDEDEEVAITKPIFEEKKVAETTTNQKTTAPTKIEEETIKIGKEETTPQQKKYTISGYVKDVDTKKPLANVAVTVLDGTAGTTTDADGFYQLKLDPGTYTLVTSALNAKTSRRKITVFNDGEVNFDLKENVETLDEVVVEAEADRNVKEVITGITKIDVEGIKNIPLVLGERDILKVATTLPGISTSGEGASGYNVRGGNTDQNLILLDGVSVYNPTHFFGIFSALNPFTTGDVNIYKGNIPAEYGGRLSSVFDIQTKDANTEEFGAEVSVGPVTSNVMLDIPIVNEKAGLIVGGRSTYSNWILRSLDEESIRNSQASFYDAILKYNHEINENNDIKATAYYSNDRFSITSDSLYGYSNRALSFAWNHRFNDDHRMEFLLTNSEYAFNIEYDGDFNTDFDLNYKNAETEARFKFNYNLDKTKNITYGIASKLYTIRPGEFEPLNSESNIQSLTIPKEKALESAVFGSINYDISEKFAIDAGLRFSYFMFLGPAEQRIYADGQPRNQSTLEGVETFESGETVQTYNGLEGRISARYFLGEDFSIKGSYNNTFQYIHTLSTNTTVSPVDTWKLSDINIEPQRAQQFALGLFKNFDSNIYEVSLEGYYKTYDNILDYKVGAQLLLNETLETEVLQGEGKSYGVEFLIRKKAGNGRWNGWLGYTYARTFIKLDSPFAEERVNGGEFFPANFDRPHDFSAVLNYRLTKRFSFSANFAYQTGRPITYPVGTYDFGGAQYTLYSDRNKFRIPDYYRLDVGFNYEGNHKIKKFAHSFWNLSIYNVLGRNNPYSVFFVTEDGSVKAFQSTIFSIPIPTLTYNFRF
ncbi:MAG: TonB-dependent receptor [bacterium]